MGSKTPGDSPRHQAESQQILGETHTRPTLTSEKGRAGRYVFMGRPGQAPPELRLDHALEYELRTRENDAQDDRVISF